MGAVAGGWPRIAGASHSQPQFLELTRISGPALLNFDAKFEKQVASKDLLQFKPRLSTDLLERPAARANHHTLVGIALDDDHRRNSGEIAVRLVTEDFDADGSRERDLLAHYDKELLPNDLFAQHALSLVGVLLGGHQRGALRQ